MPANTFWSKPWVSDFKKQFLSFPRIANSSMKPSSRRTLTDSVATTAFVSANLDVCSFDGALNEENTLEAYQCSGIAQLAHRRTELADVGADVQNEADLKFVDQLSNIHILGDAIDQFWRGKLVERSGIPDDHFPKQAKPSCALAP